MPTVPFSKTGTAPEDTAWSWDAATQNAILGDGGDDWAAYQKCHTWTDGESGAKSHYKLPHHKMVDGKVTAIWHGVTAAMARLSQADIPDADMKGCFEHLAKHYAQWGKEPPEWDRWLTDVQERRRRALKAERSGVTLPGLIAIRQPLAVAAARSGGMPTDDDMTYIAQQWLDSIPQQNLYVVPTESSNTGVDSYYTQMTPQTLQWYADDATRGVAFLDSHNNRALPIGRTFYGQTATRAVQPGDVVPGNGTGGAMTNWPGNLSNSSNDIMTAQLLTYMIRNLALSDGMNSNDLIAGISGGIYRDISVGFQPLAYWCSVCGLDMLRDWDCSHWPGQTYETKDPQTGQTKQVLCLARIDARLSEHSLVYDGATPNAMTLKAQRLLDAGHVLSPQDARNIRFVEERCRVKLLPTTTLGIPGRVAPLAPRSPISSTITNEEADTMLGSEFVARFIEVAQAEHARAGKKMSATDLTQLQAIHDNLQGGHDTMDDGLRDLAGFMAAQNAAAADNTDSASNPGKGGDSAVGDLPDDSSMSAGVDLSGMAGMMGYAAPAVAQVAAVRADGSHDAMTGTHSHSHPAFGSQGGDASHGHEHSHSGDSNHDHHASENAAPTVAPAVVSGLAALTPEQRATFDAGERYLTAVRSDAIAWAVRAGVAATPEDETRWRGMLTRFTPDEIEALSAEWATRAGERFSPRGHYTPNRRVVGNVTWTTEPTGEGGQRQTQASDPANPMRLPGVGPGVAGGGVVEAPNATEARLYALNGHGAAASGKGGKRR